MPYEIFNYPIQVIKESGNQPKYPIRQLEIGQSFWVPEAEEKALRTAAAHVNSKFHKWGIYVSVQKIDGRVWCGRADVPTERIVYKVKNPRS